MDMELCKFDELRNGRVCIMRLAMNVAAWLEETIETSPPDSQGSRQTEHLSRAYLVRRSSTIDIAPELTSCEEIQDRRKTIEW